MSFVGSLARTLRLCGAAILRSRQVEGPAQRRVGAGFHFPWRSCRWLGWLKWLVSRRVAVWVPSGGSRRPGRVSASRRGGRARGRRSPARSGSGRCRAGMGCAGRCRWRFGCGPRSGPAALGVSGEAGEPVAGEVGETHLGAGVRAFPADYQLHPLGAGGEVGHVGDLGDPGAGPFGPASVVGRCLRPLRVRGGVLLLGVCKHRLAVDVHDHAAVGGRAVFSGQLPDSRAHFGSGRADRGQRLRPGCGKDADETGDRRIGRSRAENVGLGPQHGDIGQAVPAQRDSERDIQQDPCPDRAQPAACAAAQAPPKSRCPVPPCGPS